MLPAAQTLPPSRARLSIPPPRRVLALFSSSLGRAEAGRRVTYLTWTGDGLLRHTVYVGLREDKPADQVRREG